MTRLCRVCFAGAAMWRGPLVGRWWADVLACPGCETWVAEVEGRLVGLLLLLIDEPAWKGVKRRWSAHPVSQALVMAVTPRLLMAKVKRRLRIRGSRETSAGAPAPPEAGVASRVWCEIVAVDPGCRGRGVGAAFYRTCMERTVHHGREVLELVVDPGNSNGAKYWEQCGARRIGPISSGVLYRARPMTVETAG